MVKVFDDRINRFNNFSGSISIVDDGLQGSCMEVFVS